MITIYGIKNCDTMQKAFKWLDSNKTKYAFHDYREAGIDKDMIEVWLKHFPLDKLVNMRSTTYRELADDEKSGVADRTSAIELMMKYPTLIKRPVWDFGNGKFFLGWDEERVTGLL